jgi:peptidoglycan/LPS O-acetylase OafA/YrhL
MHPLRRLFQRKMTGGSRAFIPAIDGLRFAAIAAVILFHLYGQTVRYYPVHVPELLGLMLHHADRGVRLFFVISGFILALPFARHYLYGGQRVCLRRYFLRRITRLEPPYIASLVLFAFLIFYVQHEAVRAIVPHFLATVFYCHNLVYGKMSTISSVAWSLEVEIQFYLLVPGLAFLFAIGDALKRRIVIGLMLVSIGLIQTFFPGPLRWQMTIGYFIQFFLAGLLLADLYLARENTRTSRKWDVVSIVGWPLVFLMPDSIVQVALPVLAITLYWAAFHGKLSRTFFTSPLVVCVGGMCYSLYLLHFPLIAAATRMVGHRLAWEMWAGSFLLISFICSAFYLLIEKPCMDPDWYRSIGRMFRLRRTPGPALVERKSQFTSRPIEIIQSRIQ